MDGEQPASKRGKKDDTKTKSDIEPKPSTSSVTVCTNDRRRKVPKAKEAPPKFLDLDDYCQLEILKQLSLNDLSAMAEVCAQYKDIVQNFFITKYRNLNLASLVETENGKFTLPQLRRLLYNFGHLITSLTINLDMLNDRSGSTKLLGLLSKYCIPTIDELTFENQPKSDVTHDMNVFGGISHITEYLAISMLGSELMMKDTPPGLYTTSTDITYYRGQSKQIQRFQRIGELPN